MIRGKAGACVAAAVALLGITPPGAARAGDVRVHGLLDLAESGTGEAVGLNTLYRGDTPFDAYRLRIFVDGRVSDHVQVYSEMLLDEAVGARAMGAYASITPWSGRDLHVLAGLIPWEIGTYAPRSYSDRNPLIGTPMMYQYYTTLRSNELPPSIDALLSVSGSGASGVTYKAGVSESPGMPLVYDQWWDFGVVATGSARPFEGALGFVNGSPSHPSPMRDANSGKSVLGRVGLTPTAGTRFGLSASYGPYLSKSVAAQLPAGRSVNDYNQTVAMADGEWSFGHVELRAEAIENVWQTPTVGDLRARDAYAEAKYTVLAGFYVAGRYERLRFGEAKDSTGASLPWDTNWDRWELGAGYRLERNALLKVAYQRNLEHEADSADVEDTYSLLSAQLSIRF